MRVRALQSLAGQWGGKSYALTAGEVTEVPDEFGRSITASGTLAVVVGDEEWAGRPETGTTRLTRSDFARLGASDEVATRFFLADALTSDVVGALTPESILAMCDGDSSLMNAILDAFGITLAPVVAAEPPDEPAVTAETDPETAEGAFVTAETDPETLAVLGLPDNITRALGAAGLQTLHDVDTASDEALLAVKGIGTAAVATIRAAVVDYRLKAATTGEGEIAASEETEIEESGQ